MDMNLGTKVKVDDVRWYARGEGLSVSDGGLDREKGVVLDLGIGGYGFIQCGVSSPCDVCVLVNSAVCESVAWIRYRYYHY